MTAAAVFQEGLQAALTRRAEWGDPLPYVRVSGLDSCARRQTLERRHVGQGTPVSWESSLAMIQGNWVEDGIVALVAAGLQDDGYAIVEQQRELVYGDPPVLVGHIDGILSLPGGQSLWECKAMSSFRYNKVRKNGFQPECPEYYTQAQVYLRLLRDEGVELDGAVVTVVAKDPSAVNMLSKATVPPMMHYFLPYDKFHADMSVDRAEWLQGLFQTGEQGPRERSPQKDWDCSVKFCPVYEICDPMSAAELPGRWKVVS